MTAVNDPNSFGQIACADRDLAAAGRGGRGGRETAACCRLVAERAQRRDEGVFESRLVDVDLVDRQRRAGASVSSTIALRLVGFAREHVEAIAEPLHVDDRPVARR